MLSTAQVPDESAIKPLGGLPNARFPSDHVPLVFGFRFKKSEAFTSMLPFDQPAGAGRSTEDGAAAGEYGCIPLPDSIPREIRSSADCQSVEETIDSVCIPLWPAEEEDDLAPRDLDDILGFKVYLQ